MRQNRNHLTGQIADLTGKMVNAKQSIMKPTRSHLLELSTPETKSLESSTKDGDDDDKKKKAKTDNKQEQQHRQQTPIQKCACEWYAYTYKVHSFNTRA
jgi:hypothetical protein